VSLNLLTKQSKAVVNMDCQIVKTDSQTNFDSIREVYYQTWIYSYVGLVPQALLDNIDQETTWKPENRLNNTLVAVTSNQEIVGVCTYGPARRKKYAGFGEVYSLYVLPKFQHQGIGQKLFQAALNKLRKRFTEIYLLVLKNNLNSRSFYEMFGFEASDDLIADQTEYGMLHEVVYLKSYPSELQQ